MCQLVEWMSANVLPANNIDIYSVLKEVLTVYHCWWLEHFNRGMLFTRMIYHFLTYYYSGKPRYLKTSYILVN